MKLLRSLLPILAFACAAPLAYAGSATWSPNPVDNNWNNPANWIPNTVPNGPNDVATFGVSDTTDIAFSAMVTVKSIVFSAGASAYDFALPKPQSLGQPGGLTATGNGVVNNSGITQTFTPGGDDIDHGQSITFGKSAMAGTGVTYDLMPNSVALLESSASGDHANFIAHGSVDNGPNGVISDPSGFQLHNSANAGNATFTLEGGPGFGSAGSYINLFDSATMGNAVVDIQSSTANSAGQPYGGSVVTFYDGTTGGASVLTVEGGTVAGATGGTLNFVDFSNAGSSTMVVDGGSNGGLGGILSFFFQSSGGTAQIKVYGNGTVRADASANVVLGSLEGDGTVAIEAISPGFSIGSNNLSTTFSGTISPDGVAGMITKIGTGTLTLSGANGYPDGTIISAGTLVAANTAGSATGSGPVQVNGGTLGGNGIISGAVTVGTGGVLAPAHGTATPATLTIQSALTFNSGSTYSYSFKAKKNKARADQVIANGVTINSGATFDLIGVVQGTAQPGLVLKVITNTAATPIAGTFANLPDGGVLTVNGTKFQANYEGGTGNDLVLTIVP